MAVVTKQTNRFGLIRTKRHEKFIRMMSGLKINKKNTAYFVGYKYKGKLTIISKNTYYNDGHGLFLSWSAVLERSQSISLPRNANTNDSLLYCEGYRLTVHVPLTATTTLENSLSKKLVLIYSSAKNRCVLCESRPIHCHTACRTRTMPPTLNIL